MAYIRRTNISIDSHWGQRPLYLSHSLPTLGNNPADKSITIYPDGSLIEENHMWDNIRHTLQTAAVCTVMLPASCFLS